MCVGGEESPVFVGKSGPEAPSVVHFVQANRWEQIWLKPEFPFIMGAKYASGLVKPAASHFQ